LLLASRQLRLADQLVRALEPFVKGRFRLFGTSLIVRTFVHFVSLWMILTWIKAGGSAKPGILSGRRARRRG
jgi:hypothetical protein